MDHRCQQFKTLDRALNLSLDCRKVYNQADSSTLQVEGILIKSYTPALIKARTEPAITLTTVFTRSWIHSEANCVLV